MTRSQGTYAKIPLADGKSHVIASVHYASFQESDPRTQWGAMYVRESGFRRCHFVVNCGGWMSISHPYGPLGGNMHNNVVQALAAALARQGLSTLCYDMRGVGQSSGRTSWTAEPEAQDLAQICRWWTTSRPAEFTEGARPPRRLLLIGYSYGSLPSLAVAALHAAPAAGQSEETPSASGPDGAIPVGALMVISPPSRVLPLLTFFQSSKYWALRLADTLPKLMVFGTRDQFSSAAHMARFSATICGCEQALASVPGAARLASQNADDHEPMLGEHGHRVIPLDNGHNSDIISFEDRDHFWFGDESDLVFSIQHWLNKLIIA